MQIQKSKNLSSHKAVRPIAKYAQRVSLVFVAISIFLVSFMTITRLLFTQEVVATNNLRAMARIYYEDYFYEQFVGERSGVNLATAFEPYLKTGFRPVTLRQLLSFDKGRLAAESNRFLGCDKLATTIQITPTPPFGAEDYHLETALVCDAE
ncbi:MAG: hypothetical protein LBT19_02510 [Candidatus Nomurabacteria bacterium]|jgi:hypothetical protein|nr:hypothetical protein [Candidatus Nomurabacteria bacterium]